jgi:hypothetical protein
MANQPDAINAGTALGWSVFGSVLAYLLMIVVPELVRQIHDERKHNTRYRPTKLTWILALLLLACAGGIGVGASEVFNPCSKGDAWICGLGSISFVSALLGLGNLLVPRPSNP